MSAGCGEESNDKEEENNTRNKKTESLHFLCNINDMTIKQDR